MKNFYFVVSVEMPKQNNFKGGLYSYIFKATIYDNLKSKLDNIKGLKSVNICHTKRQAEETANAWNQTYKNNKTYAFDETF